METPSTRRVQHHSRYIIVYCYCPTCRTIDLDYIDTEYKYKKYTRKYKGELVAVMTCSGCTIKAAGPSMRKRVEEVVNAKERRLSIIAVRYKWLSDGLHTMSDDDEH